MDGQPHVNQKYLSNTAFPDQTVFLRSTCESLMEAPEECGVGNSI
jgi:hypothetical protein